MLRVRVDTLFKIADLHQVTIDTSQHSAGFFAKFGFHVTDVLKDGFDVGIDQVSMTLSRSSWKAFDGANA